MTPDFVDDRLDKDMQEIRKIMKSDGTNPVFKVEFRRNSKNDIVMVVTAETNTMPPQKYFCTTVDQFGESFVNYIKDTANWVL